MVNYITVSILLNRESSELLFFKLSQRLVARRKSKMGLNVQVVSEGTSCFFSTTGNPLSEREV